MNDQLDPHDLDALPDERRSHLIRGRRLWRNDPTWLDQLDHKITR